MDQLAGDLLNESDSDDQDYVPSGAESEDEDDAQADNDAIPDEDEAERQKTNALWADFMADVEPALKKPRVESADEAKDKTSQADSANNDADRKDIEETTDNGGVPSQTKPDPSGADGKNDGKGAAASNGITAQANSISDGAGTSGASEKIKVTQIFDFAGEKIEVEKELVKDSKEAKKILAEQAKKTEQKVLVRPKIGGGLSTIVGQVLNKKNKMSILEKSKLDWDGFKHKEGIAEELANHNKGKDGYLEKMAFLERTDLRQFDIEKAMRERQRSSRGGNI
ncbi:craniofacial development protein 1-like [Tropilaelaps mercedesae]|uniref:Craniofacial development protein 1 n=1 Tax=Tropilaelaps mercedesae TaxID=418985 RepID=A0A1V9XLW4_9ACAR|nr:craniofacial development protein 1-like [Tropilaelaps mercedesae]